MRVRVRFFARYREAAGRERIEIDLPPGGTVEAAWSAVASCAIENIRNDRSPTPDAQPFVKVGQDVDESTVVCIIEAMKVMNEIKAEVRGVITQILVENAKPVEFGQAMFKIRPN